jgi:hypothetical protein
MIIKNSAVRADTGFSALKTKRGEQLDSALQLPADADGLERLLTSRETADLLRGCGPLFPE